MAKILIEVDTEAQTLVVTKNGETIPDVSYASAGMYEDHMDKMNVSVSICSCKENEDGTKSRTEIWASETPGQKLEKVVANLIARK